MLFKRIIERKSMLTPSDAKNKAPRKCSRSQSECDGCSEHNITILEEMTKMVLLGVVLWAGVTFGSHVAPYPLNLIVTSDIIHPPPMYDFPFPSAANLKRIPPVTTANTNKSINISKLEVSMLNRLETNLEAAGITPKVGSAAQAFAIHGLPSKEAMRYEKSSYTITRASQNLVYTRCRRYGLPNDECASFISTLNLRESEFGGECAMLERFTCRATKMSSKYRAFDGSCNNPVRSSWGQALTGYKRLLHPRYADGIAEPRRALSFNQLPSARVVSTKLTNNLDQPDHSRTMAMAVWGQFIYHDLVHTPVKKTIHTELPIRCCDNSGLAITPRYLHPSCMPITVPYNDAFFKDQYVTCMEYTRSVTTYRGDCTFGAAEQMNQATHFLDGSHIYGSNSRDAAALREPTGGLLKTSTLGDDNHLPLAANPAEKCLGSSETCFDSGDGRANMHPWLTSLHSLFVREHNRIARVLADLNPAWNSDKLYHEARRIVVAEVQHITYKHWLTALTGKAFDDLYDGYDTGYNSDIDPSITNSFATAALHFINSLFDQDIELYDETNNKASSERLGDNYYKPGLIAKKGGLEKVLRGMVSQMSQHMDFNYDDDLRHQWLGGLDVLAVDIQRGRDHGLPGYTQYRTLCGLPAATAFDHLADVIPQEILNKLSELYEQPADIDLVIGMLAETPVTGSKLGHTATCLLKEQLWRTRAGDRYFYTHTDEAGSFSKRQLVEIKRATLARLLCDNGNLASVQRDAFQPPSESKLKCKEAGSVSKRQLVEIKGATLARLLCDNGNLASVQRDAFQPPSESNPIMSCDQIKKVNLDLWQDAASQPDILTRTNKWIKNKVNVK